MMKKTFLSMMVFGGLFMASCSDDIYDEPRNEDFTESFIELFGQIDEKQDWNIAEQKSVTVSGATSNVKIYAKNGDHYSLVGNYNNVTDGQTLKFDAAKDVDEFVVASNGVATMAHNNETVNLTATDTPTPQDITIDENWREFSYDVVMSYTNRLPEGENNTEVEGVAHNFSLVSDGQPLKIYPVFWNAEFYHQFGIYWYENGECVRQDLSEAYRSKLDGNPEIYIDYGWFGGQWYDATEKLSTKHNGLTATAIRSQAIVVDLPKGTEYGFYMYAYSRTRGGIWGSEEYLDSRDIEGYYYSETGVDLTSGDEKDDSQNFHAAYFTLPAGPAGETYYFLGFEDTRYNANPDLDFNDLIFFIERAPTVIDNETTEWIIAAEDLGSRDDFDFNDVVFSVEHTAGETIAYVTAKAAGGILPAHIYYGDPDNGGIHVGEIHEMLGGNSDQMINTVAAGPVGATREVTVPADFTMSYVAGVSNMGGFTIKVEGNDAPITAPQLGKAPQMFCVPADWQWPTERTSIVKAYPFFGEWGANYQSQWYLSPVEGLVIGNN